MATRYWIGTTSTAYNNTANWSDTSGGATGFSVPTSADDVFFDANGNNPCVLDSTRSVLSVTFDAGFTSSFDFQGFNLHIFGIGTVVTLSANMTITGSAYLVLGNPALAGTRTLISNGKSLGNASLEVSCGNTVVFTGLWTVWHFLAKGYNTTYNAGVGGSLEVQGNFTTQGGSIAHYATVTITMIGTGSMTCTSFNTFQNFVINSTGAVTIGFVNFYGSITNIQGLVRADSIDCGVFTPGGITTISITGFGSVVVGTLRLSALRTLTLGSDLRVRDFASANNGALTLSGAFRLFIERSVNLDHLDSSTALNSFSGSILSLVGSQVTVSATLQCSFNIQIEIDTPGNVIFALPSVVVLTGSPTNRNFILANLNVIKGNLIIPPLLCFRFTGSGATVIRGANRVRFGFVTFTTSATFTFDEFFCGTPERPVVINNSLGGSTSIAFTTQGEKFARFVRISNATVVATNHLVITATGRTAIGGGNKGIHFSNVWNNSVKQTSSILVNSLDGVDSMNRVLMLVSDPTKV